VEQCVPVESWDVTEAMDVSEDIVADHFSIVVCYVCWRHLWTVYQHMCRNRWQKVGGVVEGKL